MKEIPEVDLEDIENLVPYEPYGLFCDIIDNDDGT